MTVLLWICYTDSSRPEGLFLLHSIRSFILLASSQYFCDRVFLCFCCIACYGINLVSETLKVQRAPPLLTPLYLLTILSESCQPSPCTACFFFLFFSMCPQRIDLNPKPLWPSSCQVQIGMLSSSKAVFSLTITSNIH